MCVFFNVFYSSVPELGSKKEKFYRYLVSIVATCKNSSELTHFLICVKSQVAVVPTAGYFFNTDGSLAERQMYIDQLSSSVFLSPASGSPSASP